MTEGISSSLSGANFLNVIQNSTDTTTANASTTSSSTEETTTKSTNEILSELRQDEMSSTMTAQDIADEYGVSLSKAQEILSELRGENGEYTLDNPLPEDSTVSYHV